MFRIALPVALVAVLAAPSSTVAQDPGPAGGARRFQPPPDHWMTLDSLSHALSLTADQKTRISQPYTALNGVMKDAAARRAALRQQRQAGGGGSFQPGAEPSPEMRARMDSVRAEMEGFQAEADEWLAAIRSALTPAQQAKFDALPKPVLARPRPSPRGM